MNNFFNYIKIEPLKKGKLRTSKNLKDEELYFYSDNI